MSHLPPGLPVPLSRVPRSLGLSSLSLMQQRLEGCEHGVGQKVGAFGGGVDAVLLDGAGNVDEVFVDHGNEGGVVPGGEVAKGLVEGLDVVGAVVGRESDSGKQDFDMRVRESRENSIKVVAGHVWGQAAEAVIATEFHDHDFRVQAQDPRKAGDGVFGGGAAGALVADFVVIAAGVEFLLQKVGKGLAGLKAVTGGDAVAVADEDGTVGGSRFSCEERGSEENQTD